MTTKGRAFLSSLLDLYVSIRVSMLVILVNVFDAIFSRSYRKHQVKYDLIGKLSHITFLSTAFLVQTSRVEHRTIERFKIEKDLRGIMNFSDSQIKSRQ